MKNAIFSEFVVCFATNDMVVAKLHAYRRGDGSVRDQNHVQEIIREFCSCKDAGIISQPPGENETVLFEIRLCISETRHGHSNYGKWGYQRFPACPNNVAEAGMDIYGQFKKILRRCKKRKEAEEKEAKNEAHC